MASAMICLSKGQRFNFSRVGKGCLGVETPFFENMLQIREDDAEEEVQVPAQDDVDQENVTEEIADDVAQPTSPLPPSPVIPPSPPHQSPRTSPLQAAEEDKENVFNQGRINVDIDEGIELVDDQEKDAQVKGRQADTQAEIYNIDLDHTSKVVPAGKPAVVAISAAKPAAKPKGVVIRDPEEELHDDTLVETQFAKDKGKDYLKNTEGFKLAFFKGKTYDQIRLIFQARFDANMRFLLKSKEEMEKEQEEIIKSINKTPAQKAAKRRRLRKQAKEAEDFKKQLEVVADEDDDVFVEATPIGTKVPVVNYEIVMLNNKPRYKIFRADDTHQLYTSFITLLKNFDREDLEDLWKIMKARFSISKPTNFTDDHLLATLKNMFEKTDAQDVIWRSQQTEHGQALVKSWKLLTSCGVHIITFTTTMFVLLVEKKYPLSRPKENTKCVSAAGEEFTAARAMLMLLG
nr:hypothetical protein [Tanacetum cinerariifolium]